MPVASARPCVRRGGCRPVARLLSWGRPGPCAGVGGRDAPISVGWLLCGRLARRAPPVRLGVVGRLRRVRRLFRPGQGSARCRVAGCAGPCVGLRGAGSPCCVPRPGARRPRPSPVARTAGRRRRSRDGSPSARWSTSGSTRSASRMWSSARACSCRLPCRASLARTSARSASSRLRSASSSASRCLHLLLLDAGLLGVGLLSQRGCLVPTLVGLALARPSRPVSAISAMTTTAMTMIQTMVPVSMGSPPGGRCLQPRAAGTRGVHL